MGQPVVHFEIGCRNKAKTARFFETLFDWKIPDNYLIDTGSKSGIPGHVTSLGHEPENFVTIYIEVDDVGAALAKVQQLGGKRVVGPIEIPTGTFAWFNDLDGNLLGLWKNK